MKDVEFEKLIQKAEEVRKNAYVPYSGFAVGAALFCDNGNIYTGCNIENSSYGLTVCAERVALFKAISSGEKRFRALAISAGTIRPIPPCGACRQVLAEFNQNLEIIMTSNSGENKTYFLSELLPEPFTQDFLIKEVKKI